MDLLNEPPFSLPSRRVYDRHACDRDAGLPVALSRHERRAFRMSYRGRNRTPVLSARSAPVARRDRRRGVALAPAPRRFRGDVYSVSDRRADLAAVVGGIADA